MRRKLKKYYVRNWGSGKKNVFSVKKKNMWYLKLVGFGLRAWDDLKLFRA